MRDSIIDASIGGILIGLSALIMFGLLGKITGISSILWRSITPPIHSPLFEKTWRPLFLLGLVIGAFLAHSLFNFPLPSQPSTHSLYLLIAAGLLVGFGAHYGSGCTSGHGICGIGRLSKRSIVATSCFMLTGIMTVYVTRHLFLNTAPLYFQAHCLA